MSGPGPRLGGEGRAVTSLLLYQWAGGFPGATVTTMAPGCPTQCQGVAWPEIPEHLIPPQTVNVPAAPQLERQPGQESSPHQGQEPSCSRDTRHVQPEGDGCLPWDRGWALTEAAFWYVSFKGKKGSVFGLQPSLQEPRGRWGSGRGHSRGSCGARSSSEEVFWPERSEGRLSTTRPRQGTWAAAEPWPWLRAPAGLPHAGAARSRRPRWVARSAGGRQ